MAFSPNGHVPVGTGQQLPYGAQPPIVVTYQPTPPPQLNLQPAVVVIPVPVPVPVHTPGTTYAVTVEEEPVVLLYNARAPGRHVPHQAQLALAARARYTQPHHPPTPPAVLQPHQPGVRQIPGAGRSNPNRF